MFGVFVMLSTLTKVRDRRGQWGCGAGQKLPGAAVVVVVVVVTSQPMNSKRMEMYWCESRGWSRTYRATTPPDGNQFVTAVF